MKWAGKVARMLLPWPSRTQRREAIDAAADERRRSQAAAAAAAAVSRDIWRLAEENHWAAVIARDLRNGRGT